MKNILKMVVVIFTMMFIMGPGGCRPKDLEGAFVHYGANRYDEALVLAEKVTKEIPTNPEGWFLLGKLYGQKDRIADMVMAFDKSLEIAPTHKADIEIEKQSYFAKKFNSGANLYNKYLGFEDRTSEEAIAKMENSIKSFSDANTIKVDYKAIDLSATGYKLLGRNDDALKSYSMLTETFPDSSKAWLALGKYHYDEKDYTTAVKSFEKSTELDDKNSESLTYLAQSYDFLEMPDKAIPAYKKAIEANDDDAAIPFNLGLLLYKAAVEKGVPLVTKKEKLNMAIEFFTKSIELNPDFISSYQLKGNSELLIEKYADARMTLEEGVNMFPEDGQMWEDLAKSYALLGEKEKANEAYKRADELNK
ncbi:MAG: hypothetical protein D8M58_08635 [Calditrichaeota bacterium]|nr:MAG: hypothetical protein DWQ03_17855 [Calditrichota bacterium]MBL1205449.1 hypothetical protein [Calditrichota bacterium]NOG45278.1 tetratricopeptide repeat protein [Calditrichota bacterium]